MRRGFGLMLCAAGVAMLGVRAADAQVVSTRAQVTSFLGSAAATEDFSQFNAADNTSYALDSTVLDSNTVDFNRGPGLVNPGLTFSDTPYPSDLNMQGAGEGSDSAHLAYLLASSNAVGTIAFSTPTSALGVDLFAEVDSNASPANVLIDLYDQNQNLLYSTTQAIGDPGIFFGYESASDPIATVTLSAPVSSSSANVIGIDNLLYAGSVPEPGSLTLLAIFATAGTARRRAR